MKNYNWGNVRIMLAMAKQYGMTAQLEEAVKQCVSRDVIRIHKTGSKNKGFNHPLFMAYRRYVRVSRMRDRLNDMYIFGDIADPVRPESYMPNFQ